MKHAWLIVFIGIIVLFFYLKPGLWDEFKTNLTQTFEEESEEKPEINQTQLESDIHNLINEMRENNDLTKLALDPELSDIARQHSQDMAENNYFSHNDSSGNDFTYRYTKNGYFCRVPVGYLTFYEGGENIFQGNTVKHYYKNGGVAEYYTQRELASDTVSGWMSSPGHRENILQPYWAVEGIGVVIADNEKVYVTQNFC